MAFGVQAIDLSFNNERIGGTGNLQANYYTVPGVENEDGSLRPLSIGQLVMALCLARATELEAQIIDIVEGLNKTSEDLERLTEIESAIVEMMGNGGSLNLDSLTLTGTNITYYDFLTDPMYGINISTSTSINSSAQQLVTDIESKMDSLNSFSQQTMIELQSLTAKRDQSYDLISNILKSLNQTLLTNVNNL